MIDNLMNLCKILNLKLSYTANKVIILSCSFKKKHALIRAHNIFKECNEEVAYAIIGYCTNVENREENLKIIKDYADKNFISKKYKIIPPNDELLKKILKVTMQDNQKLNEKYILTEMNISSIFKNDFYGNECISDTNEPLNVNENEILELNITVKPFDT